MQQKRYMRQAPENSQRPIRNYREMSDLHQARETCGSLEVVASGVAPDYLKQKEHGTNYIAQENQSLKIRQ